MGDNSSGRSLALARTGAPTLVLWHAVWLAILAIGAGAVLAAPLNVEPAALAGLALGACPALAGLFLGRSRHRFAEVLVLANWGLGGALAAGLAGGFGGPLAIWLAAPIAAAAAMGRAERMSLAVAISAAAIGLLAMAQLTQALPPPPPGGLAAILGAVASVSFVAGLGVALVLLQRQVGWDRLRRLQVEARLTEALDQQPYLLLSLFPGGKIAAAWGLPPRELSGQIHAGRQVTQLAALADRAALEVALTNAMADGRAELRFIPAGGSEPCLELSLRRASHTRIMGLVRDVRRQLDRERALESAREAAETRDAGKSRFLANMSHELRTPLNAIMGFSDIMRQRLFGPLPEKYGEYAELIHESGGHLLELINDVLDMSKIEAERFELHREEFDVREAANAVLRLMRGQADRAGVQLRGVLPKDPLEVDADRRALKQIALNLISNALKFTPKGGAVTLTVDGAGDMLEIIVADTGAGISAEDIQRLGRPYEQAGAQEQRAVGTGLGLSLVRAFAELHGGEMIIESRLGEGTTVTVRMPVVLPAVTAQPAADAVAPSEERPDPMGV